MKAAVVGRGYVGMASAVLLAQHNTVVALDINAARVAMINRGESTVEDKELCSFLANRPLDLIATTVPSEAYNDAAFVVVATPTNVGDDG